MKNLVFRQLFEAETSTYTYLLADPHTKDAVLIDPVLETVDRDLKLISELGLKLKYILDTHIHADHITGAGTLREKTGAKTVVSHKAQVNCVDVPIKDGDEIKFGSFTIKAFETPGHTDSCMSYYCEGKVFTGDALLIRGTGRTDFQQGSSEKLYDSVTKKIFTLPEETEVYPGHDYRGHRSSTVLEEKSFNPRLGNKITKSDFVKIMSELKLANPKKIHEAVPANLACGKKNDGKIFHPQMVDGRPEITPEDLKAHTKEAFIVDVRRPEEFIGELGHIQGAKLVTLGDDLINFLKKEDPNKEIVFVCRSGGRSGQAVDISKQLGFKNTINMTGGMIRWNDLKYPVQQ